MASDTTSPLPAGVSSLLDTDMYKLTMQCCIFKFYPTVPVTYSFTNRTPDKMLSRKAFEWLREQVSKLADIALSSKELEYLQRTCTFLSDSYLHFLSGFRFDPASHLQLLFAPVLNVGQDDELGNVSITIAGKWVDTILYEIPLLALVSEAYFKYCDMDWVYAGQHDKAHHKGLRLLHEGCIFSEFGTRRRRDYHTQDLVIEGLQRAQDEADRRGWKGKLSGTSNVHFAMKYGLNPVGTVAHEWFMGVASITKDYEHANETALRLWIANFGQGVLGIALTDTFGTPTFLEAFKQRVWDESDKLYAHVFTGVRQDSGDPLDFVRTMRQLYSSMGITEKKTIVFSDSLNIERCLEYKAAAEADGFQPTFGVGTFLTNDFTSETTGEKSEPLKIVIKMASANGQPAIKISDNVGKNTGDKATVEKVKHRLGYQEQTWADGDETRPSTATAGEAERMVALQ